jgi:hypothetical protein
MSIILKQILKKLTIFYYFGNSGLIFWRFIISLEIFMHLIQKMQNVINCHLKE